MLQSAGNYEKSAPISPSKAQLDIQSLTRIFEPALRNPARQEEISIRRPIELKMVERDPAPVTPSQRLSRSLPTASATISRLL
ncbi:hypothetical protein DLM45_12285 [Hyphomicrobium methylovorum]|nr:hypothetical protein [Hyphomicrobium methylovorum]